MDSQSAKFAIGQVVRHRVYPFRGVIFDVDPIFANTEEYWLSIPEHIRPHKDQPFYHLLAENEESSLRGLCLRNRTCCRTMLASLWATRRPRLDLRELPRRPVQAAPAHQPLG